MFNSLLAQFLDGHLEHFTVLRKSVGDVSFPLRNKIERKIQQLCPAYASLYHNISFTCKSYQEALQLERQFSTFVDELMRLDNIIDQLDDQETEMMILEMINSKNISKASTHAGAQIDRT